MVILWPLAMAVGTAGLIAVLLLYERRLRPFVTWSGLSYLGRISFGIYLFHPFVITALLAAFADEGPRIPVVPLLVVSTGATILVASVFHTTVERPAITWGKRVARTWRPPPGVNGSVGPIDGGAPATARAGEVAHR